LLARPKLLVLAGWAVVILVAILMLVFRGREEAGPAVVFAVIAVAVGAWVWRRESRAAMIASLVLGLLWVVQFAAYTVADLMDDDAGTEIFVTDVIAVIGGLLLVGGAIQALVQLRRQRVVGTP
jgi:hypothetical protein